MRKLNIKNIDLLKDYTLAFKEAGNIVYAIPNEKLSEIQNTKQIKKFSELDEGFLLESVFKLNSEGTGIEEQEINVSISGLIFLQLIQDDLGYEFKPVSDFCF